MAEAAADPFGTAAIRRATIAGWAGSPTRFREDANTEEDFALGGYRDRLVVELAQNAADAAAEAGIPGVLRLTLAAGELRAANVGAPLSRTGVESLASLRASAKQPGAGVGRFGVGFAAVLPVTDEPRVVSRSGSVRFSAAETARAVAGLPAVAAEIERRGGQLPVLRLPWPSTEMPPSGFDTEVRLPLRDPAAVEAILDQVDPTLLLALPALQRIEVGGRVLRREGTSTVTLWDGDSPTHWRIVESSGPLTADLLADRTSEERAVVAHPEPESRSGSTDSTTGASTPNPSRPRGRGRTAGPPRGDTGSARDWTVRWAVKLDSTGRPIALLDQVIHAPTSTREPLSLPARLIADFPLAPDRRTIEPGRLTDFLVGRAGAAYAELVAELSTTQAVPELVPMPVLASTALDAALVRAAMESLWHKAFLPTVDGDRVAPDRAVAIDADLAALAGELREVVLTPEWSRDRRALDRLGVARMSVGELVELLAAVQRPARWWRSAYDVLAALPSDQLAGLPVPLVSGRTAIGARGVLLPEDDLPALAASRLGLRVAEPAAAHPLLWRLGAQPATPETVLADPDVRAQVEFSYQAGDPGAVADAVLDIAAVLRGAAPGWLAALALPDDDGGWCPAGEMLLPGSPLSRVVSEDAPFGRPDPDLVRRWGVEALERVGVLTRPALLRAQDVGLEDDLELDGEPDWWRAIRAAVDRSVPGVVEDDWPESLVVADFLAVRDLELLSFPAALELIDDAALVPCEVLVRGRSVPVTSYTRWWLGTHPVLSGARPDRLRTAEAVELAGLYDVASVPAGGPDPASIGVRTSLADVLAQPDTAADLLGRLADPCRFVDPRVLRDVYARAAAALRGREVRPPAMVRVASGAVVPAETAAVADWPQLLPLLPGGVVPAGGEPLAVAQLLDLPLASELVAHRYGDSLGPDDAGEEPMPWSAVPGVAFAASRCGGAVPAGTVTVHDRLTVAGVDVDWWPGTDSGTDHVARSAGAAALGRALAARLGAWDTRAPAAEALAFPKRTDELAAEDAVS